MKYVKTFENFNYDTTNENWLWGEGNIFSKIGNWIRDWKDRKLAEGARIATEWTKNNPEELEELKAKVKPIVDKISEEEKNKMLDSLQNFQGNIPTGVLNESVGDFLVKILENFLRFMGWSLLTLPLLTLIASCFVTLPAGLTLGAVIALMPAALLGFAAVGTVGDLGDGGGYGGGSFRSGFTG